MHLSHILSCLSFAVLGSVSLAADAVPLYTLVPVGSLGGGAGSGAAGGLNNSGQVVGFSYDGNNLPSAYLAGGGAIANLNPAGAASSRASAVNDAGTVVGEVTDAGRTRAAVFGPHGVTLLGTLGGTNSYAYGINRSGQIAGVADIAGDAAGHAFVTQGGAMRDLGTLAGDYYSLAHGLNDSGVVVGYSGNDTAYHGFVYRDGAMADIGTLGGNYSEAWAVNAGGAVAGSAYLAGDLIARAFVYANGVMLDLGALDATHSYAYDLNDAGEVVGGLEYVNADNTVDRRAFLYSGGRMVDLNSMVDPGAGWTLQWASAINDRGQISAYACTTGWNCQDVLLSLSSDDAPAAVPEPAVFTAGLAGLALAGLMRRRRSLTSSRFHPPAAGRG